MLEMLQFVILNWHNEKTHENAQVNKLKIVRNVMTDYFLGGFSKPT